MPFPDAMTPTACQHARQSSASILSAYNSFQSHSTNMTQSLWISSGNVARSLAVNAAVIRDSSDSYETFPNLLQSAARQRLIYPRLLGLIFYVLHVQPRRLDLCPHISPISRYHSMSFLSPRVFFADRVATQSTTTER